MDSIPESTQQTIPYEEMYRDGICRVEKNYYTITMQFYETNYVLISPEDKQQLHFKWCEFLDFFDPTISLQFTYFNHYMDTAEITDRFDVKLQHDGFDALRVECGKILKDKFSEGNNGLIKEKFITVGVHADSLKEAKIKLGRIKGGMKRNFQRIEVPYRYLGGTERILLLHRMLHIGTYDKCTFPGFDKMQAGNTTKDYVAPEIMDFRENEIFRVNKEYLSAKLLNISTVQLPDMFLVNFLNVDKNFVFTVHVKPLEQKVAVKQLKIKMSDIQSKKIDEQKKAIRAGYDPEMIPLDIDTFEKSAKRNLEDINSQSVKMYDVSYVMLNAEKTRNKLNASIDAVNEVVETSNCEMVAMTDRQEQGFISSLPLGLNMTEDLRRLVSNNVGVVPFTSRELFSDSPEAIYYGMNSVTNNLILADRKELMNPNGLILGKPGGGKSFSAKREIFDVFNKCPRDDFIICDPEGEYYPVIEALQGQVIHMSAKSHDYINPMDVNLDVIYNPEKYQTGNSDDDEDISTIISDKSDFIQSFCEIVLARKGNAGLEGDEKNFVDTCVRDIYEEFLTDSPSEESMPTLTTLYEKMSEKAGDNVKFNNIKNSLEMYVTGSLNVFNHRTNIEINSRIVCFDIKKLSSTLRKLGMFIIQNSVWTRVSANRNLNKFTRYYIDEFHLLLKQPQTASYSLEIWKRFRKWGGIPTGITQNVGDLLNSPETLNIFNTTEFYYLLKQSPGEAHSLGDILELSGDEISTLIKAEQGEGIVKFGNVCVPFEDKYPTDTMSYKIMSTKPGE